MAPVVGLIAVVPCVAPVLTATEVGLIVPPVGENVYALLAPRFSAAPHVVGWLPGLLIVNVAAAAVVLQFAANAIDCVESEMPPCCPLPFRLRGAGTAAQRLVPATAKVPVAAPYVVGAKVAVSPCDPFDPKPRLNVGEPVLNGAVVVSVMVDAAFPVLTTLKA